MSSPAAVMPTPSAWFQQIDSQKVATDKIIQMNRLAVDINASQQKSAYADLSRAEKLSYGIRDSLERNNSVQISAVERNNSENRTSILKVKSEEARQEAANFEKLLIGSKDNRIAQAREVTEQKYSGLKSDLEFEVEVIDSEGNKGRDAILSLQLQDAQQKTAIQGCATDQHTESKTTFEIGTSRMELELLETQLNTEKTNTFLALQTERTQADTNRRMVLDRAATDSRVQAVTAAATLQEAENHTKVLLYQIQNSAASARGEYEAKQLLRTTTAQTEQVVTASSATSVRDALAAARAEAAILRSRPRS